MSKPINGRNGETNESKTTGGNKYGIVKKEHNSAVREKLLFIYTISGFKAEGNKICLLPIFHKNAVTGKEGFRFNVEIAGERIVIFANEELNKTLTHSVKVEPSQLIIKTLQGDDNLYHIMGIMNKEAPELEWD